MTIIVIYFDGLFFHKKSLEFSVFSSCILFIHTHNMLEFHLLNLFSEMISIAFACTCTHYIPLSVTMPVICCSFYSGPDRPVYFKSLESFCC